MHWQHYGLREAPFSITPDPSYIFYSDIHKQVFYELLYGIKTRKGFMELTGPVGAGKTTLYRALLQTLGTEAKTALVINPSLSPIQLLQTIVEDFEITPERKNKKGLFDALNTFLLKTDQAGSTAVLIIDEAQDLTAKTLEQIRLLSNFETNKTKLLQIMLVGQPELHDLLAKKNLRQLRQRITVSANLEPLGRQEIGKYIAHRIAVAGGSGMLMFDDAAIDEIYNYSEGVPRIINVLADKVLFMSYLRESGQEISDLVAMSSQGNTP
jgi:general secretion pathway protein A